jgi:hypothetical protein
VTDVLLDLLKMMDDEIDALDGPDDYVSVERAAVIVAEYAYAKGLASGPLWKESGGSLLQAYWAWRRGLPPQLRYDEGEAT